MKMKSKFSIVIVLLILVILNIYFLEDAEASSLPELIRIGFRKAADPIANVQNLGGEEKKYGGFCEAFRIQLQKELSKIDPQITTENHEILNEYRGVKFPRYDGLKKDKIDIECGPNSLPINIDPTSTNSNDILFSEPFYTTGIKLMVKKELFKDLKSSSRQGQNRFIKTLNIAAMDGTTTFSKLEFKKNQFQKIMPYTDRKIALKDLEDDKVQAFASDAIILQTLLQNAQTINPPNRIYKQSEYAIFPPESQRYIIDGQKEQYALAINRNTSYAEQLINVINSTLKLPALKIELDNLRQYEDGQSEIDFSRYIIYSLLGVVVIILGFTFWHYKKPHK